MPKIICGNGLLFHNFSHTDYSTFSDGRVVGTIELLVTVTRAPFYVKSTWNMQVTSWLSANSKIMQLAHVVEHKMWAPNWCSMSNYF